jgi:PAS domain S-box-containing protein
LAILKVTNENTPIHILHVDDDPSIQEITKLMLLDLNNGFDIDWACCVDEAFKKLATCVYDVVISDYEMPQKDGLQFLKELREQNNEIPFILFTGKGREEVAIEALNCGADRYFNKQGNPECVYGELAHSIKSSVDRKKIQATVSLNEIQLQYLLSINKMLDASEQELFDFALEAITKTTQSGFAFIDLLNPDETVMTIHSWSKTAMNECKVRLKPIHLPVSEAGIWAEPIRQRKPIIIDDYSVQIPHKKGVPEGHVEIKRFLGVPVFEKDHIVAIAAVANKKECYDEHDVNLVASLVTDMWRLIQRKKTVEIIQNNEARYRELANFLPEIVFETDLSGKITFFSQNAFEITGFTSDELEKGMNMLKFVVPEDRERAKENIRRRMAGEKSDSNEYKLLKRNGDTYPAIVKTALILSENKIIGLRGLVVDIAERKKAEQVLMESEARLRTYLDSISTGLLLIDPASHVILDANVVTEKMFGASKESIVGSICHKFVCPAEKERCPITDLGQIVDHSESTFIKVNSETLPILKTVTPITLDGRKLLLESFEDITELKRTRMALENNEGKYREFAESLPQIVFEMDSEGTLVFVNQRASQITGYSIDEFGKNFSFIRLIVPEEIENAMKNITKLLSGESGLFGEFHIIKKDGSVFPAMVWANPIIIQNKFAGLRGIVADISDHERVEEELKRAAKDFQVLNEKLRMVSSLLRHDVGNKLMAAKSNLYLLKKHSGDKPELAKYFEGIDSAFASSDKLFEFSHFYERVGIEKLSKIDVAECFNQAAALFQELGTIRVVNNCQGLEVWADSLLRQLFYNLIDNSLKHGEKVTQMRMHLNKNEYEVNLFFEDNGVGVPEANKPKLFEIGFTTGGGSGLGLHLIKKMVEVYGWSIEENGEPGKGAKFTITIPVSKVSGSNKRAGA